MARPKQLQSNWNKGIQYERDLARMLRSKGLMVIRSAGSLGLADLIAIDKDTKTIKLIQCKKFKDGVSDSVKDKILEPLLEWEGDYKVIAELL